MTNDMGQQPLHVLCSELLSDVGPMVVLAFMLGQQNPDADEFIGEDARGDWYVSHRLHNFEKFEEALRIYATNSAAFMEHLEAQCSRLDHFESGAWEAKLVSQIQQGASDMRRSAVRIDALTLRNRELTVREALLESENARLQEQFHKATERIKTLEQNQAPALAAPRKHQGCWRPNELAASIAAAILPAGQRGQNADNWSL